MNRKTFLAGMACATLATVAAPKLSALANSPSGHSKHPRAITMWEFSWIERRWPGAGYEDWDRALDELRERGYNAVRIDPFPHLLCADPHKIWTLLPEWNTQDWGSPDVNRITLLPALFEFIGKCRDRGILVGLSTWFRQDEANTRMTITGPDVLASMWIKTLDLIAGAGLLDAILYTDLCNEWPGEDWAPFMKPLSYGQWDQPASLDFMQRAITQIRAHYPQLPLFFSCATGRMQSYLDHDISYLDLLDPHIWMSQENNGEFYNLVGYHYERFDSKGYTNLSLNAEPTYRARPAYWQSLLTKKIDEFAAISSKLAKPLITTECWGVVDYKDWPLLKWDWIKDLCLLGATHAASTGQWLAIASSNFCGPQFAGMWRDTDWHQQVTRAIKSAAIQPALRQSRLYTRL
ncbi:MAG: cellulase-like family protein [Terracidiphilus sp.]